MLKTVPLVSYPIAVTLGLAHAAVSVAFWGLYLPSNPIIGWLSETLARQGHATFFTIAVYSHDFTLDLILTAPFMLFVAWLRPGNSYRLMWTTIAALYVSLSWYSLIDGSVLASLLKSPSYYVGFFVSLAPSVLAFRIIVSARHYQMSPNGAVH